MGSEYNNGEGVGQFKFDMGRNIALGLTPPKRVEYNSALCTKDHILAP
jgi:hypothetical protein